MGTQIVAEQPLLFTGQGTDVAGVAHPVADRAHVDAHGDRQDREQCQRQHPRP